MVGLKNRGLNLFNYLIKIGLLNMANFPNDIAFYVTYQQLAFDITFSAQWGNFFMGSLLFTIHSSLPIHECSVFGGDGDLGALVVFDVSDDLSINVEALGYVDDALGGGFVGVDFHTVSHVEDFVHLLPVGAAFLMDHLEEWGDGEEVVLDDMEVVDEVQYFCLSAAAAMYHAADVGAVFVQDTADDGGVGACGREHHLAGIDTGDFGGVGETAAAAIDHLFGEVVVVAHGVVLGIEA